MLRIYILLIHRADNKHKNLLFLIKYCTGCIIRVRATVQASPLFIETPLMIFK